MFALERAAPVDEDVAVAPGRIADRAGARGGQELELVEQQVLDHQAGHLPGSYMTPMSIAPSLRSRIRPTE